MQNPNTEQKYLYELKNCFLTDTEKKYLSAIQPAVPEGYYVQPQVNLASIIHKTDNSKYMNELYRNIDVCIFDLSHKPIALIEINDSTHNEPARIERDKKVAMICEEAGIPLIKLWTSYGVNPDYIQKRISEAIEQSKNPVRICHFCNTQPTSPVQDPPAKERKRSKTSACYIATCVYGSYDCPEVWVLRRFRDMKLARTWYGRIFIRAYYALSPHLVRLFGNTNTFRHFFKPMLDRLIAALRQDGFSDTRYDL